MGLLNELLLGDLAHAVQVGAVAAGRQRHRSMTGLERKRSSSSKFAFETKRLPQFQLSFCLK